MLPHFFRYTYTRVGRGSLFADPTRPDPFSPGPDPTRPTRLNSAGRPGSTRIIRSVPGKTVSHVHIYMSPFFAQVLEERKKLYPFPAYGTNRVQPICRFPEEIGENFCVYVTKTQEIASFLRFRHYWAKLVGRPVSTRDLRPILTHSPDPIRPDPTRPAGQLTRRPTPTYSRWILNWFIMSLVCTFGKKRI